MWDTLGEDSVQSAGFYWEAVCWHRSIVNYIVPTPQDRIIDQLESDIEHLKMEIFELKGVNKLLKKQLKEATEELQKNQRYYDDVEIM